MKRCRTCRQEFSPFTSLQVCCSAKCSIEYARKSPEERKAKVRKLMVTAERREARERLKSRRDWLADAQVAFNAWIRERDYGLPCISCGRDTGAKRNAGHYLSVGSHPELRFEPLNAHSQCEHCNQWKSGNAIDYRIRLIEKIGLEQVEWLEGPHEPLKPSVDWLRAQTRLWRAQARFRRESRAA